VQEYRNGTDRIAWAVWSPTGEGKRFTATLDPTLGKLLNAERMPLAAEARPVRPLATQQADGRIDADVDESPLYLIFQRRQ
jgi:hypothetical protein